MQLEIDFARYPAARFGDAQFDVPLNVALGRLKKTLRAMLHRFPEVERGYLLVYSDPAWGDTPRLIVSLVPRVDTGPLYSAWEPRIPEFGPVGFFGGVENRFSFFMSHAATPFYCREQTPPLPPPFSKAELIHYLQTLPDVPVLAATEAYLETLKENYDQLPSDHAAKEYAAQQMEMEQALQDLRSNSTHPKAKAALLSYLTRDTPFGLVLRTFSTETTTGGSPFGDYRRWMLKSPLAELLAQFSPLPLAGIANPNDPFSLGNVLLLETAEDWLRVVRSCIAIAAKIYVLCDRLTPGVESEFLAIQAAEREDDTFILLPGPEQAEYYRDLYSLTTRSDDPGPHNTEVLRRKLATFGLTGTTEELNRALEQPPPSKVE